MFQSPVSDSKDRSHTSPTVAAPEPKRELHPRFEGFGVPPARAVSSPGAQRDPAQLRHLQSTIGNRAVLRSLSQTCPRIQTKLTIDQPGDRFEQEADHVADRVMRMSLPGPDPARATSISSVPTLQRKCACGGSCSHCQSESSHEHEHVFQAKLAVNTVGDMFEQQAAQVADAVVSTRGAAGATVQRRAAERGHQALGKQENLIHSGQIENRIAARQSYGSSLPQRSLHFMESRFQSDFGDVRIHTDTRAYGTSAVGGHPGAVHFDAAQIRQRQSLIGNQAMLRSISKASPRIQTKLTINKPGDQYEQGADRVAGEVMQASQPGKSSPTVAAKGKPSLQRKCNCGSCQKCQAGSGDQENGHLQKKSAAAGTSAPVTAPSIVNDALRSPGRPLDPGTRSFMESRFGQDFSAVRVHTCPKSTASAREVNARAYTVGQDLVFGEGQYRPETAEGKGLIAHELVHTLQQRGAGSTLQRQPVAREKHEPSRYSSSAFLRSDWTDVNELGIVQGQSGVDIQVAPHGADVAHVAYNQKVFILKEGKVDGDPWYAAVDQESGAFGYILQAHNHVWRNLPDPDSQLLFIEDTRYLAEDLRKLDAEQQADIQQGKKFELEKALKKYQPLQIVRDHYKDKGFNVSGEDLRYVVNAIVCVNAEAKHNTRASVGIYKPSGKDENWSTTQTRANTYIWLPGVEYLKAIYKHVTEDCGGTGSIKQDLLNAVRGPLHKLAYGAAFVGGLFHGILQSLWDTVSGLGKMIYGVLKFFRHIVSNVEELADAVRGLTWQQLKGGAGKWISRLKGAVQEWAEEWSAKLDSTSPWTAGHAHGYLTGYVMAEVFLLLVGGEEIEAVKGALEASELGKAIAKTKFFKDMATAAKGAAKLGGDAAEIAGALRKLVGKIPVVGTVVKVFEWSVKGIMKVIQLPSKWARQIAEKMLKAVRKVPVLRDLLPEVEKLTPRAQKWLFGCHNPCEWDAEKVAAELAEQKAAGSTRKIEAEAEAAEQAAAPHPDQNKPPKLKTAAPDPDPAVQAAPNDPVTKPDVKPVSGPPTKSALIEELKQANTRLSRSLPSTEAVRGNIKRLEREIHALSGDLAAAERKFTPRALARNPELRKGADFKQMQDLKSKLKAYKEGLEGAQAELRAVHAKQAPIFDEMNKNNKEIAELSKDHVKTAKDVISSGTDPLMPGRSELGQYGIDKYGTFSNRPGDKFDGHEMLQNLWLEEKGYGERLSGISRNNPAMALTGPQHDAVDAAQKALGLFNRDKVARMTATEIIDANALAMKKAGIPDYAIETLKKEALKYATTLKNPVRRIPAGAAH